jgi:hypothetical protein
LSDDDRDPCQRPQISPTTSTWLLAFYEYPAEHWIHLRTTNPIESTFATVTLSFTSLRRGPSTGSDHCSGFVFLAVSDWSCV